MSSASRFHGSSPLFLLAGELLALSNHWPKTVCHWPTGLDTDLIGNTIRDSSIVASRYCWRGTHRPARTHRKHCFIVVMGCCLATGDVFDYVGVSSSSMPVAVEAKITHLGRAYGLSNK
jgi:hypothetical protein